jgi:hypothetical protein
MSCHPVSRPWASTSPSRSCSRRRRRRHTRRRAERPRPRAAQPGGSCSSGTTPFQITKSSASVGLDFVNAKSVRGRGRGGEPPRTAAGHGGAGSSGLGRRRRPFELTHPPVAPNGERHEERHCIVVCAKNTLTHFWSVRRTTGTRGAPGVERVERDGCRRPIPRRFDGLQAPAAHVASGRNARRSARRRGARRRDPTAAASRRRGSRPGRRAPLERR